MTVFYSHDRINFDIETTSYVDSEGTKKSIVYSWALCINGEVEIYRTRDEFIDRVRALAKKHHCSERNRIVIYVHNLAFEYEFIRRYFDLVPFIMDGKIGAEYQKKECFFIGNSHRPARLLTVEGIEFRCSYLLTNASLARVGEQVGIPKMLGDLDYSLPRHHETPLTEEELGYIRNDVLIVDALIAKALKSDPMGRIPMTLTGYTRRRVRSAVKKDKRFTNWLMNTPLSESTYDMARTCFRGGYTHASAATSGTVIEDVVGWDIASSYPASIVQFKFPMSEFVKVYPDELEGLRYFIHVRMSNVRCKYNFAVISESACEYVKGGFIDNGRVFNADELEVWMTDVDFEIASRNYEFDLEIRQTWAAESDYLPTAFVKTVLEMYRKKTMLKGVAGSEDDYADAKVDVNSVYGMTAEDPVHEEFDYYPEEFEARKRETIVHNSIMEHNDNKNRFLYYPWAAWVTSGARYVLQMAIMDAEDAGIGVHYCDTDSMYVTGDDEAIRALYDGVNVQVTARMIAAMRHHGFADDAFAPATIEGEVKPLGLFEEDSYRIDKFKSLGAKRYAKVIGDRFELTVSGLAKRAAAWVQENGGLDLFEDGMHVPADVSGRMIHTYLDTQIDEEFTDYLGNTVRVQQWGGVHLSNSEYRMGISDQYERFLNIYQR